MMTALEKKNILRLGPKGCAAVVKLVEARARHDIEAEIEDHRKAKNAAAKVEGKEDGWFKDLRKGRSERKVEDLEEKIDGKKRWVDAYEASAWENVSSMEGADLTELRSTSLAALSELYMGEHELELKRFLILQEAAMTPLYSGDEEPVLVERETKEGCELVSTHFGFPKGEGYRVLKEADSFIKDATGYWTKVVDWSLDTTFDALRKAREEAVKKGGAVGGLFLVGRPEETPGKDKEEVMVTTAKVLNYMRFLKGVEGVGEPMAKQTLKEVYEIFLNKRHELADRVFKLFAEGEVEARTVENMKVLDHCFSLMVEDLG